MVRSACSQRSTHYQDVENEDKFDFGSFVLPRSDDNDSLLIWKLQVISNRATDNSAKDPTPELGKMPDNPEGHPRKKDEEQSCLMLRSTVCNDKQPDRAGSEMHDRASFDTTAVLK